MELEANQLALVGTVVGHVDSVVAGDIKDTGTDDQIGNDLLSHGDSRHIASYIGLLEVAAGIAHLYHAPLGTGLHVQPGF